MWLSSKKPACQCRKHRRRGFDPWVGEIPWRRRAAHPRALAWRLPWTEEPGGLLSQRYNESGTSEGAERAQWFLPAVGSLG